MAIKTFYPLTSLAVTPNWWGNMQDSGSAPAGALSAFGSAVAAIVTTQGFWNLALGANAPYNSGSSTSWISASPPPPGGGPATPGHTGTAFVSPTPYTGVFPAGNWAITFGMRCGTPQAVGRIRLAIWKGSQANASNAVVLSGGALACSIVTLAAVSTTYNSTLTWAAPAITLNNEYLFFQVEWQETTAGTVAATDVRLWQGASTIVTTNFSPYVDLAGDLSFSSGLAGIDLITRAGSQYGMGSYGAGHYSRSSFQMLGGDLALTSALAADLSIDTALAGDLATSIAFSGGALTADLPLVGDLALVVSFSGDLEVAHLLDLAGDLAPQIALAGDLGLDLPLVGDLPLQVNLACPGLIVGPLWAGSAPEVPPWASAEPCPPPVWASAEPCPPPVWGSTEPPSFLWTPIGSCDPVDWEETELCNG